IDHVTHFLAPEATAREEAGQPPLARLAADAAHPGDPSLGLPDGQLPGIGHFVTVERRHRPADVIGLDAERLEVPPEPGRSPAPGGACSDVRFGEGGIVDESQRVEALQRSVCRLRRVSLEAEFAGDLQASMGSTLEHSERRAEGTLDIGSALELLTRLVADGSALDQSQPRNHVGRDGPRRLAPDQHPDASGSARVGTQAIDLHSSSPASSLPTATAPSGLPPIPSDSRTLLSTSLSSAGLSLRNSLAFSRPCPIRWSPYEYQAPDFWMMPASLARSTTRPVCEIPSSNITSNSACLNGGATLFLTTLTRTREPITA